MGNKPTTKTADPSSAANHATLSDTNQDDDNNDGKIYALLKRRPGCTGMFWRQDPSPGAPRLAGNAHWPRDGAHLRGRVLTDAKGKTWLITTQVRQQRGTVWKAAPLGSAIPFEYDKHYYLQQVKE